MALATITETLELPGGVVPTGTLVTLRLIAVAEGNAVGYASSATVLWTTSTTIATDGTYTFTDVRPNVGTSDDAITSPAGTVYELRVVVPGATSRPAARYISVPDSTGPHQVADLLTIAPDPLPTGQDLLDLIDAAGLDLTDLPNGVTADAVIGLDGGALVELTPAQVMATHTGDTVDAHDASAISYAGGTGMSATDVEAAIDELANEKANLAGAAFTGAVTVTGADLTVTGAGGGSLHLDTNPSDDAATLAIYGSGDTQPRIAVGFSVFDVPAINMGPGGSTPADVTLYRSEAGVVHANGGGFAGIGKGLTLTEQSAPSTPAANDITLYAADNGGTTVLRTKDSAGTVTTLGSGAGLTAEDVRDTIGSALVAGEGIDITVNDGADTITVDAELASDTNPGVVELATTAETQTGSDTARAVTPAGASATYIAKALPDAKGDLIAATAADTPARLAVGADGTFLVADAASSTGLKYVALPWRISIPPTAIPSSSTGYTLPASVSANYFYNCVASATGINNQATWKVLLAAGTWRLDFFYTKFSSYGIATVSLGDSTVATVDAYAAGVSYNNRSSTTGISVTSTGIYDLRFLVDAKNASSSAYSWGLSGIELVRTA